MSSRPSTAPDRHRPSRSLSSGARSAARDRRPSPRRGGLGSDNATLAERLSVAGGIYGQGYLSSSAKGRLAAQGAPGKHRPYSPRRAGGSGGGLPLAQGSRSLAAGAAAERAAAANGSSGGRQPTPRGGGGRQPTPRGGSQGSSPRRGRRLTEPKKSQQQGSSPGGAQQKPWGAYFASDSAPDNGGREPTPRGSRGRGGGASSTSGRSKGSGSRAAAAPGRGGSTVTSTGFVTPRAAPPPPPQASVQEKTPVPPGSGIRSSIDTQQYTAAPPPKAVEPPAAQAAWQAQQERAAQDTTIELQSELEALLAQSHSPSPQKIKPVQVPVSPTSPYQAREQLNDTGQVNASGALSAGAVLDSALSPKLVRANGDGGREWQAKAAAYETELGELRLDLEEAKSEAAKQEAEKELANVQVQVLEQEVDMSASRMQRETQILQDELDEVKAKFRSYQEESEAKQRAKDRHINMLKCSLEVAGVLHPMAPAQYSKGFGAGGRSEPTTPTDSPPKSSVERALGDKLAALAEAEGDSPPLLRERAFGEVAELMGMPSFLGCRLYAHALVACAADEGTAGVEVGAFEKFWRAKLWTLDSSRRLFKLLSQPGASSDCVTLRTLTPVVVEILKLNSHVFKKVCVREKGEMLGVEELVARCAKVITRRVLHFACRGSAGRLTRLDWEASDLEDVFDLLAQGGDALDNEKVTTFFAVKESASLVKCFGRIDTDGDGRVTLNELLQARNANVDDYADEDGEEPEEESSGGLVPRCGAFTLSQAALEGVFRVTSLGGEGTPELMSLGGFADLFHAYVYPHAPVSTRFWFSVADLDNDGVVVKSDLEHFLMEQCFILNSHLEQQGEYQVFQLDNLLGQAVDMVGPGKMKGSVGDEKWTCAEVLSSRAGLVLFDVLFNYEVLLRYERQSSGSGGQPYVCCALTT